jgi:hypothetical protein
MGFVIKKLRGDTIFAGIYYFEGNENNPFIYYKGFDWSFGIHLLTGEFRENPMIENEEIYKPVPIDESVVITNNLGFFKEIEDRKKAQIKALEDLKKKDKEELQQAEEVDE